MDMNTAFTLTQLNLNQFHLNRFKFQPINDGIFWINQSEYPIRKPGLVEAGLTNSVDRA